MEPAAAAAQQQQQQRQQHTGKHPKKVWQSESYALQSKEIWPGRGQHILAQYDEDSIVVYQAFKKDIADYAVRHQRFEGCPAFGLERMTWVKTNFLWMMYRSGWGWKHNQDHILAIWLKRSAFDTYLENAREKGSARGFQGTVRLQWDPDHLPNGESHPYRRAVQLGLKGLAGYANGDDIVEIQNITPFVHEQSKVKDADSLLVSRERVYTPTSKLARESVGLSPAP